MANIFTVQLRPQLKELFWFSVLFSFASALITIFEPVFFYQQGFSLARIALYYALHYTLYLVLVPLGGKFAARFGLERSLALSMPVFVIYFLLLAAIPWQPNLFYLAWIFLTLHKIFYWPAYHADFAKFADGKNRGTELSWMNVIIWLVGILGPLVGGFIAVTYGFPILFVIAAATCLIANLPLLKTAEHYHVRSFGYADAWRLIRERTHRPMVLGMLAMGEELIAFVFWPIWLYLIFGGADRLGFFAAIVAGATALFGFLIGEAADRVPPRKIWRWHLPLLSLASLLRPLATITPLAFVVYLLDHTAYTGMHIPIVAHLYKEGKKAGVLRYAVAFETVLIIAKAATAWLLVLTFALLPAYYGFTFAFILAAMLSWLYWLM